MASHQRTVNFLHLARHAPKGRVMTKVAPRSAASRKGLCSERSIGRYVAEVRGAVKDGGTAVICDL